MSVIKKIIDFCIPPRCVCNTVVNFDGQLCTKCWNKLNPIIYFCEICGHPFNMPPLNNTCIACQTEKPQIVGRSAFFQNDFTIEWSKRLHNGDQTHIAKIMAYWMARCDTHFFDDIDVIFPQLVGFHTLVKQRYSVSVLIAKHISKTWKIRMQYNLEAITPKENILVINDTYPVSVPKKIKENSQKPLKFLTFSRKFEL